MGTWQQRISGQPPAASGATMSGPHPRSVWSPGQSLWGEVPRGTQEAQGLFPCTAHLEGPLGGQGFATSSESTGQTPALQRHWPRPFPCPSLRPPPGHPAQLEPTCFKRMTVGLGEVRREEAVSRVTPRAPILQRRDFLSSGEAGRLRTPGLSPENQHIS